MPTGVAGRVSQRVRLLLTGATGQFGQAFQEVARAHKVCTVGHRAGSSSSNYGVNLEEPERLSEIIQDEAPDWVVHAAALTNVDDCERNPAKAMLINSTATEEIAVASRKVGARFAFISTDYVFDGRRGNYSEDDETNPINAYGESKLRAERGAAAALPTALICRTSVVFGPHKNNFVLWCARELAEMRRIRVVTDQNVCATSAYDLSRQVLSLIEGNERGIYHTAGASPMSRFHMAHGVAQAFGLDSSLIQPAASGEMAWTARRPLDSTLSTSKVSRIATPQTFESAMSDLKKRWKP